MGRAVGRATLLQYSGEDKVHNYLNTGARIQSSPAGRALGRATLLQYSGVRPVEGTLVGMIAGGIDLLMLLLDWYLGREEKRIQGAKEEGIAEGKAEVYQEIAA